MNLAGFGGASNVRSFWQRPKFVIKARRNFARRGGAILEKRLWIC
jgi:hypothetical protein